MARVIIIGLLVFAAIAGIAMYYLQVYAFYEEVEPAESGNVQLTALATGLPEPIEVTGFEAIDSISAPIQIGRAHV